MKKQEKIFEVQNLSAKIEEAKSVALTDYRGLSAKQLTELREKVQQAGGELQVTKNSLLFRALKENQYQFEKERLEGPTLALFSQKDEISPLRTLADFAKTSGLLPFKIGFMAGSVLSLEELNRFAYLPSKIELQAKLLGLLTEPQSRLVRALNWNLQRLVLVLSQVKNKKQ